MKAEPKYIALEKWSGRHYYEVEVVGETATKTRVRILDDGGVILPSGRYIERGATTLVPKYVVRDKPIWLK